MTGAKEQQRRRLATIRAIALLAARDHQHQPVDEIEEAGDDENPPENLPAVSRASHYS